MSGNLLERIREAVRRQRYFFTFHAVEKAEERGILSAEVEEVLLAEDSEIIEDYPDDPRGASCLILGWTARRRPLHILSSYQPVVQIITVYEPDPEGWTDYRERR